LVDRRRVDVTKMELEMVKLWLNTCIPSKVNEKVKQMFSKVKLGNV